MKYIKRVILENFQSHKYSVIEFKEQLNVIVGPSDSGKSAIIRGIKWALYNEPSGDYFIKEGEKECSVTIEFNDKVKLKRYRSKYKNSYILTDRKGEEIKFEGFGSTIPNEIIDTIGIKKIHLDSDESNAINLGEQLEGAFLLGEKSATRASAIGRLVGVNIIDDALREVLKDTRNLNIQKKSVEESIYSLEKEIKEFDYIEELKIKSEKLENLRAQILNLNSILNTIKTSFAKLNQIKEESNYLNGIIDKLAKIDKVNETIIILDKKNLVYRQLSRYCVNLKRVNQNIIENKHIHSKLTSLELVQEKAKMLDDFCYRKRMFQNFLFKYEKIKKEEIDLQNTISKLKRLPDLGLKLITIDKTYNYLILLEELNIKYKSITSSLELGNKYLSKLNGIDESDKMKNELNRKIEMLNKYHKHYYELLTNKNDQATENESLSNLNKGINIELIKYEDMLKKLEICPFCLSGINDDKINHIINHYIGG